MRQSPHLYALALGSNRRHGRHGAPARVVAGALAALEDAGIRVLRASPVLETPALGPAGRRFANAAALVETALAPPALLATVKAIEARFGRRRGRRWGPRVLDIDLALWSSGRWRTRALTIPHPGLATRLFMLQPLAAVVPGWRDPASGLSVRHLLARARRARAVDRVRPAT
jgi:2-amino-4-hydroxy-6-hydroxymethyldihydropteridine diphosphokinase